MTNYYVLAQDMKLAEEVAFVEDRPEDYDSLTYWSGIPLKKQKPLKIKTDKATPSILTDHLLTIFRAPIFSEKAIEHFGKLGVKNIECHPVELELHETGEIVTTYSIANVLGHIECLDIENSEIRRNHRTKAIIGVEEFRINEKQVKPTPHMHGKALLFRMAEFPDLLIAHEKIAKGFRDSDLTGFRFVETENYMGV